MGIGPTCQAAAVIIQADAPCASREGGIKSIGVTFRTRVRTFVCLRDG